MSSPANGFGELVLAQGTDSARAVHLSELCNRT